MSSVQCPENLPATGQLDPAEAPAECSGAGEPGACPPALPSDSIADSVLILLALTGVQRLVGFARSILFCRWLDPEQLGQWDMAFSFLMLAAPVAMLSLAAAFPRYVPHYHQRGQLRALVRRTALACAVMAGLAIGLILLAQRGFSQLIFGTPQRTELVALLAVGLAGVIAMNYLIELFSALRNVRLIAGLQLLNSPTFAGLGGYLLLTWHCAAVSVLLAYVGACALTATVGSIWLMRHWRALPGDGEPPPHRALWAKLLPFAAWIWVTNIIANLFVIADRYMIVHYSTFSTSEALAQVGEYHSSRVLPVFLISITAAVSSIVTAHLAHDWETGRRDRVAARLNLFLKLFGFALSAAAVMILFVAPLLFGVAFSGKFASGLAVLPWTLTYCLWFAMFGIADNYLLCREKAYLGSIALGVGLVVNVGLNLVLLPRLGLLGAVLATTAANLVALVLLSGLSRLLGLRIDAGTWVALALPAVVCLGPWVALVVLVAVAVEAAIRDRLLSPEEKRQLIEGCREYRQRLRAFWLNLRPAQSGS